MTRCFQPAATARMSVFSARSYTPMFGTLVVGGAMIACALVPSPACAQATQAEFRPLLNGQDLVVGENAAEEANRKLRGDDTAQGFTALFNGRDLSGWKGAVEDYEVRDGAVVCKPDKGGVLFTDDQYADFIVRIEFKVPAGGNNGLAIRYPGTGRASYDAMCELQILDDDAPKYATLDPRQYHGSVYGMVAAKRGYLRPVGQWNYQQVTVRGSRIIVELNGTIIVDADVAAVTEFKDNSPHPGKDLKQGHFGLAGHNDPVEFRNIAIKRIE